jgi:hypothetical protein
MDLYQIFPPLYAFLSVFVSVITALIMFFLLCSLGQTSFSFSLVLYRLRIPRYTDSSRGRTTGNLGFDSLQRQGVRPIFFSTAYEPVRAPPKAALFWG